MVNAQGEQLRKAPLWREFMQEGSGNRLPHHRTQSHPEGFSQQRPPSRRLSAISVERLIVCKLYSHTFGRGIYED